MKIYQPIAGLCLTALLSACGGGGGDATPAEAAKFSLDAAYTKAFTNGVNLNGTAIDGVDTWTISLSITPAADEAFEGVIRKKSTQALTIKNTQIAEELALPPVKIHCSILAEDAIKAAVQDYKAKHGNTAPSH